MLLSGCCHNVGMDPAMVKQSLSTTVPLFITRDLDFVGLKRRSVYVVVAGENSICDKILKKILPSLCLQYVSLSNQVKMLMHKVNELNMELLFSLVILSFVKTSKTDYD